MAQIQYFLARMISFSRVNQLTRTCVCLSALFVVNVCTKSNESAYTHGWWQFLGAIRRRTMKSKEIETHFSAQKNLIRDRVMDETRIAGHYRRKRFESGRV